MVPYEEERIVNKIAACIGYQNYNVHESEIFYDFPMTDILFDIYELAFKSITDDMLCILQKRIDKYKSLGRCICKCFNSPVIFMSISYCLFYFLVSFYSVANCFSCVFCID